MKDGVENLDGSLDEDEWELQTVRRPPTRKMVEKWIRVKKVSNTEREYKKEKEEVLELTQHVKIRVRNDSDDSMGSELTCSLPSVASDSEEEGKTERPVASKEDGQVAATTGDPGGETSGDMLMKSSNRDENLVQSNDNIAVMTETKRTDQIVQIVESEEKKVVSSKESEASVSASVSDAELIISQSPTADPELTSQKKRRISWGDQTAEVKARLAKSPGFRQKFTTPTLKKFRGSQIKTTSPGNSKTLLNLAKLKTRRSSHVSMLCLELHVQTREKLLPDPNCDSIAACFYRLMCGEGSDWAPVTGVVAVGQPGSLGRTKKFRVNYVSSELVLVKTVARLVRDIDPDFLAGYEVQMTSWGYLSSRAATLGLNMCPLLSRVPFSLRDSKMMSAEDNPGAEYDAGHTSELKIVGRTVLNVWRLLRSELALYSYSLENVVRAVLGQRRPSYDTKTLTCWWSDCQKTRMMVVDFYLGRLLAYTEVLTRLDLVARSCELARLFGIQMSEVASRGSQYRVESSMLRLAKPRNFVPVSPSREQLAGQAAPEYLALLLEPESRMYSDPVIVLDFQSLYPSIMIAYNYCFTTCLGRVKYLASHRPFEFGCTQLKVSPERLENLRDQVTISPGGVVFVQRQIRQGILPRMLEDILTTRIMVKQSMKKHKADPHVQRLLHSRQLGLKLIANVTYGYTSANFSGRMPCIEVGDSVVAKGRETLETTVRIIESNKDWGAKVVYGDTDSVFVLLKGRTKEEAFDIGEEMSRVITQRNPKPVKLKFEKVYLPCILQTKKRYVGYMYETRDQAKPVYEAKGIETVRRDGIPATVKILEKSLRILFETKDLTEVKHYVLHQFHKIHAGRISQLDLTFAREFRGLRGYKPTACVPALELTRQALRTDRRAVPRVGERVPYVVVYGEPGLPLIQLVRPPGSVVDNPHLRLNSEYYITKVIIPALNR